MIVTPPKANFTKNSHCSYCGAEFTEQKLWPRKCFICWNDSYHNPPPVVVALVPVYDTHPPVVSQHGWLIQQRNIEPQKGGWAFPGGYIEVGETWQQAAARELHEEVGLIVHPEHFSLLTVKSTPTHMVIFGHHIGIEKHSINFHPNDEVTNIDFPISPDDQELCFATHNEAWREYYNHG